MNRRRRKEILGQWGPAEADPREQARGRALQAEIEGSAVAGRRVEIRRRHFRPTVDSYVASLGGPLPYMVRLREIDRLTREAEAALAGRWRELADECRGDPESFTARWREAARRFGFHELNDLVDRHNRWYPIEARLAMDVKRRDYVLVNGRPYRQERRDADWVLARFPADLGEALRDS
jgi:hypothetical protein